jgi:hypothetical protein
MKPNRVWVDSGIAIVEINKSELVSHEDREVLKSTFDSILDKNYQKVIVDLVNVKKLVDDGAIGPIIELGNKLQKVNGTMVLLRPQDQLRRFIIDLAQLNRVFPVFDSFDEAKNYLIEQD